jgi:hypothetical protein
VGRAVNHCFSNPFLKKKKKNPLAASEFECSTLIQMGSFGRVVFTVGHSFSAFCVLITGEYPVSNLDPRPGVGLSLRARNETLPFN